MGGVCLVRRWAVRGRPRAAGGGKPMLVRVIGASTQPAIRSARVRWRARRQNPGNGTDRNVGVLSTCYEQFVTLGQIVVGQVVQLFDFLEGNLEPFGDVPESVAVFNYIPSLSRLLRLG